VNLEMHLENGMVRICRRYSSERRDALGGSDPVNLEVYLGVYLRQQNVKRFGSYN